MPSTYQSELEIPIGGIPINPSEIAEATLRAVQKERSMLMTSWPQRMQQEFPNLDIAGDYVCTLMPNAIMLSDVSEVIAATVTLIQREQMLGIDFADPRLFMWESAPIYTIPIAKRIPRNGYTKPHWIPLQWILMPSRQ